MRLKELLTILNLKKISGEDVEIKGISHYSKDVRDGELFVALKGERHDGHSFIGEAIERGAVAFLIDHEVPEVMGRSYGVVDNTREALGLISSYFYRRPCEEITLIGVTGTNGKTTTTYLLESILKASGRSVGVIGTINYRYKDRVFKASHTTPESSELQKILREMADEGITYCVMEVSSHSIVMNRLIGCEFAGGIFTNLSQDHLDFHRDMNDYFEAKAYFFTHIVEGNGSFVNSFSVINIDDPKGREIVRRLKNKVITYGRLEGDIRPKELTLSKEGIEGSLNTPKGTLRFKSTLIGDFNLYNIMAGVGGGIALDLPSSCIEEGIKGLSNVRGRMEKVYTSMGLDVIIDYAHTPDALEKVLDALTSLKQGRIITVFGCGGDRDKGKRPLMGRISATKSDITILTSDNPRGEDPMEIIKDIKEGIDGSNSKCYIEPDRRKAIKLALSLGEEGDTILIAGKGHEDYQIIKGVKHPFDDRKVVKEAIREIKGERGMVALSLG